MLCPRELIIVKSNKTVFLDLRPDGPRMAFIAAGPDSFREEKGIADCGMVFFPAENKCTEGSENKDVVTHAFFREEKLGPIQMRCTRSLPCPMFPAAPTPVCVPGESEGVKEGEQILIPVVSPSLPLARQIAIFIRRDVEMTRQ